MMLAFVLLVVLLGWLFLRLPSSFLPEEDQGYVVSNIELPTGATANRTVDVLKQVEDYFMKIPAVENVIAIQGYSFNGNGLNAAIAFTTLRISASARAARIPRAPSPSMPSSSS